MSNLTPGTRLRVLHILSGDLWAGAEAQAHTLLKNLRPLCDVSAILLNEGELAKRLRADDIDVTILDEAKLSSRKIFTSLRVHIRQLKPDVVHTHRQKENILGALANATTVKAHCVRTVHGAPEFSGNWQTRLQRSLERWVGRHYQDLFIAVSHELRDHLAIDYPGLRISTVPNGVDVAALRAQIGPVDIRDVHPNKRHLGIIGRLVPIKRIDIFLKIAARLRQENNSDFQFHIIGAGPCRPLLESQARALNIVERVTFHGHREDIPSIIAALDAVLICSDHEGLPMVALETLALDTLLIAHNIGGLSELADYNTALLTRPNSPASYYKTLTGIADFSVATENFSHHAKKNSEQTMALYSAMTAGP